MLEAPQRGGTLTVRAAPGYQPVFESSVHLLLPKTEVQIEAALRLLYYFPATSGPMIAARLARFDVAAPGSAPDAWAKREAANGIRIQEFIEAISGGGTE